MGTETKHEHPHPLLYRTSQFALAVLLVVALVAGVGLILLALVLRAPLFVLMGVLVFLLALPVLMGIVNTPPVTVNDDALTIHPFIGSRQRFAWDQIQRIDVYPLLPQPAQEVIKQALVGRRNYQPADGIMLVIPALPVPYRIAGVLAGAGNVPVIALTNRTHTAYDILKRRLSVLAPDAAHGLDDIHEERNDAS